MFKIRTDTVIVPELLVKSVLTMNFSKMAELGILFQNYTSKFNFSTSCNLISRGCFVLSIVNTCGRLELVSVCVSPNSSLITR